MSGLVTQSRRWPWVWGCVALVLLSRIPAMLCPYELNRDESQMAAQAMRYGQDLTPWRSVEGETNGPLDSWFLLAASKFGVPLDYRALHVLAALCLAATLLGTYGAARRLVGETAGLVGLAAAAWWLAWSPVEDLVHYASELVPGLCVVGAVAVFARGRRSPAGPGAGRNLLAGVLLGLAPWGKLQAGPVALAVGLWAVADVLREAAPIAVRRRAAAALLAGAVLPSVLFLGWVTTAGAGEEFWRIYVLGGIYHGRARPWGDHLRNLEDLLFWRANSPWLWDVALLAAGACWLRSRRACAAAPRWVPALALLWLGAALFAALRPITQWIHYTLLVLPPLALTVAVLAGVLLGERAGGAGDPRRRAGWAILAVGLLPLPVANFFHYHYYRAAAIMAGSRQEFAGQIVLAQAVRHFVPRPRSLAVWGWKPSLYVDLGVPPATRNAVCAFLTDGNPNQDFLRAAYMRDLEQAKPEVVVDVEDYVYRGRRRTAPATFPALAELLARDYVLAGAGEARRTDDYAMVIAVYTRRPGSP